jgi:hypothetical protein
MALLCITPFILRTTEKPKSHSSEGSLTRGRFITEGSFTIHGDDKLGHNRDGDSAGGALYSNVNEKVDGG